MRKWMLLVPVLVVGCGGRKEEEAGKAFFQKFHAALLEENVDLVWQMMSLEARQPHLQVAKMELQRSESSSAYGDDSVAAPDLPSDDLVELAKHSIRRWIQSNRALIESMAFVKTVPHWSPAGDSKCVVFRHPGADRDMLFLIEVDGTFKLYLSLTLFHDGVGVVAPNAAVE
jgi:hypothetical protein